VFLVRVYRFALRARKEHSADVPREQPIIRRPKSDGRCIHCREPLTEATKDHVFPSSWYPDTTPDEVQRWTAPSCESCNGHFGELEKNLLVYLAYCINPTKPAAQGLYERARRTIGIRVEGLSEEEKRHREARRRKMLSEVRPYSPEIQAHIIPGLGPHPEAPVSSQLQLMIKAEDIYAVVKKIVRGCEYWLSGGRIVEPPYEIEVFFPTETPEDVNKLMAAFALGPVFLGPGLRIPRGGAHDDPLTVLYDQDQSVLLLSRPSLLREFGTASVLGYLVIKKRSPGSWFDVVALLIMLGFGAIVLVSPARVIRYSFPTVVALPFLAGILVSGKGQAVPCRSAAVCAGIVFGGLLVASVQMRHRPDWQSLRRCNAVWVEAAQVNAQNVLLATDSPTLKAPLMALAGLFATKPANVYSLAYTGMSGVPIEEDFRA
jgi:hypothetical protein